MKKENEEKRTKMFNLILTSKDYELLTTIKENMRFTTIQQAARYVIYSPVTLFEASKIKIEN